MEDGALSITDMNAAVLKQFQRVTGGRDGFAFAPWWAEREREVIRNQCESSPRLAAARWALMPRDERQLRILAHLRRLPIATNPLQRLSLVEGS